jgi:putative ABC transport system permease protein
MRELLFQGLVRLLPEEFRAAYARDMRATLRAEMRDAGGSLGGPATVRLWIATAWDVLCSAASEHAHILARDTRFALRTLRARPAHALTALVTLALGIGANVAMFAVVDGVLLAPLPYRDPAGLVAIAETNRRGGASNVGYLSFADLRVRARTLGTLAATSQSTATLLGDGREAERVNAMRVSHGYFEMLGVRPALGRAFSEAEDQPGAARRVAILSDRLWRDRYGADPRVIGRPIDVSGVVHQVVGVLPRGFEDLVAARLYEGAELWFPLGYDPAASFACRTCRHLRVFARLAPGADAAAAERELSSILRALGSEYPTQYDGAAAAVTPLAEVFLGPVRPVLLLLWAGVLVLLVVACSNVANLLLLRASERSGEVAVRAALGVTAGRLTRQLLTESLLLATAGGLAGTLVGWAAVRVLVATGPAQLPRLADVALDARALAAALALSLASAALFGLVPLRQLVRGSARPLAGAGRRTATSSVWRIRSLLVAGNVAMAGLLLVGSGLLVRSLAGLLAVAPGFDPAGVLTMQIWLGGEAYRRGENRDQIAATTRFYDELLARVGALPGVSAASAVTTLPLGGGVDGYGLHIAGRPHANPEAAPSADRFVVAPRFFAALGIPLLRGRLLEEGDAQDRAAVVVVNRALAESLFPGEDPLGYELSLGPPSAPSRRIVGVVGDVRHHGLHVPVGYQVYVPQAQWAWAETFMTLVVRSQGDPGALAAPIREIVRSIDPAQPVTQVRRYQEIVDASLGTRRFATVLLSAFAGTGLAMALVGLYGALGVYVGQRRLEIGVRLALGAPETAIRRMVLGQGMRPVLAGLVAGLVAAAFSAGLLRTLVHEVGTLDPGTFLTTVAVLLASTLAACYVPAWRASRIDPAATLRTE